MQAAQELPSGELVVQTVSDGRSFAALRSEWTALHEQSDAGIFTRWEWIYPWYLRIGAKVEPLILIARSPQGELLGLLPLALSTVQAGGRPLRRLGFLGDSYVGSDYLDVIAKRGLEEPVTRAFLALIASSVDQWDLVDLLDLSLESQTLRWAQQIFPASQFELRYSDRFVCPYERFEPQESFEQFLKRTARKDNYNRRRRWLEREAGLRIEVATAPTKLEVPMAAFFRLHRLRWAEDGGSSGIRGPAVESFHRDATALLAEAGKLRLYTLFANGVATASVYGLVHGGKFIYYQSGYDPQWRSKSVGLVLVGETFRDAISLGLGEFDFLRGTEAYKADWTSKQRKTVAMRIFPRGGQGAWLERFEESTSLAKRLAKALLPASAVDGIRRYRQRRSRLS